jgi:hypothetical protein
LKGAGEGVGEQLVVAIDDDDPMSRGVAYGVIASGTDAAVLFEDEELDTGVVEIADSLGGVVGRAVIHNQNLEVGEGLRQATADCAQDLAFPIEGRGDEAEVRQHGFATGAEIGGL